MGSAHGRPSIRASVRAAAAAVAVIAITALAPAGAVAATPGDRSLPAPAHRASASFYFQSSSINAGTQPLIHYTAHKPRHGKITLQRKIGSHFHDIVHLKGGTGAYEPPAVPQGKFVYRLLVKNRYGKTVAKTSHDLFSFAPVPMATFLETSSDTVQIAGQEFRYVDSAYNDDGQIIKVDSSSCNYLDLQVGADADAGDTTPAVISVIQENADPYSFKVSQNSTSEQGIALQGGAWEIDTAGDGQFDVYVNGTLSCFTPTGSASGLYY